MAEEPRTITSTNYFTQMSRAAEMMAEHDQRIAETLENYQDGSLKVIASGIDWTIYDWKDIK